MKSDIPGSLIFKLFMPAALFDLAATLNIDGSDNIISIQRGSGPVVIIIMLPVIKRAALPGSSFPFY